MLTPKPLIMDQAEVGLDTLALVPGPKTLVLLLNSLAP